MLDLRCMVELVPGLPDLILFLANDMSVVHVFRCGLTRSMLLSERVLALILIVMTGRLLKMLSNWAVLAKAARPRRPVCIRVEVHSARQPALQ